MMVHEKDWLVDCLPSDTDVTTLKTPAVVGTPSIRPIERVISNPGGRPFASNVTGCPTGSRPSSCSVTGCPTW
jgi:hypothetical protein